LTPRKALGRGLDALLPGTEAEPGGPLQYIDIEAIRPNARQPRRDMDDGKLKELALSIEAKGLIQPLVVRRADEGYEIIAGERRWRAAGLAGLDQVPVLISEASDAEALELALIENIQREDLNPIEEAAAYRQLTEEFGLTQEETAARVGKDRATVANYMRLLLLPVEIQDDLRAGRVTMGHARAYLGVKGRAAQMKVHRRVMAGGLSVRETEALVSRASGAERKPKRAPAALEPHLADLVEKLKQRLSTQVRVRGSGKRGRMEIEYYTEEELSRLADLLLGRRR